MGKDGTQMGDRISKLLFLYSTLGATQMLLYDARCRQKDIGGGFLCCQFQGIGDQYNTVTMTREYARWGLSMEHRYTVVLKVFSPENLEIVF